MNKDIPLAAELARLSGLDLPIIEELSAAACGCPALVRGAPLNEWRQVRDDARRDLQPLVDRRSLEFVGVEYLSPGRPG